MDAFVRAFRDEMRGATENAWYELLRWMHAPHFGTPANDADLRADAKRRTDAGEIPPFPDFD